MAKQNGIPARIDFELYDLIMAEKNHDGDINFRQASKKIAKIAKKAKINKQVRVKF